MRLTNDALPDKVWPELIVFCGSLGFGHATSHWILGRDLHVRMRKTEDADYPTRGQWYGEINV